MRSKILTLFLCLIFFILFVRISVAQTATANNPFPVGASVEVLYGATWYAATVKEVRPNGKWLIGYDGWSATWDEEVSANRIRFKVAKPNQSNVQEASKENTAALSWPVKSARATTPIEGAYLVVTIYSYPSYTTYLEAWFFTKNGRFTQGATGGFSLQELSARPRPTKNDGTYWVENGELVMAWADGREQWRSRFNGQTKTIFIGSRTGTLQGAFVRGWRMDGSYEGGASVGGGAVSSSNRLNFHRNGTYTRGAITNISSVGRETEVSGGAIGSAAGTYEFNGHTLTLRENGIERKYTVFAYGQRDAAGRPEQIFWEGILVKRLN